MKAKQLNDYKYAAGVGLIIIIFLAYKFRFLSLPYYWDEAWPYSAGVHDLYRNGLSLLPGAISSFVARGHPLMFHFLAAGWMKIFGTSLLSGHSFAMAVSVMLIISIYLFCKFFFSERIGFVACLLFSSQAIFISQSAFLMPEVLMGLWTMLCFTAYFTKRYFLFIVFGTAMLLTKESGAVFFVAMFVYECTYFIAIKRQGLKALMLQLLLISTPVLIASINFIIQKLKFGWFLYPFYMDYISGTFKNYTENISTVAAYVFVYYGRNGFSFFILISLIAIFAVRKLRFTQNERKIIPAILLFVFFYIIFCTVNYYIPRYLLCVFAPFYIAGTVIIDKLFGSFRIIFTLIISGLVITSIFFYAYPKTYGDMDYSPSVITDLQMVDFCEHEHLYDSYIFTTVLLRGDLSAPDNGYLSGRIFTHIQWEFSNKTTEYCIFSEDENDPVLFERIKKENKLQLVKRFEQKYAWCELYKVVRPQ